MIIGLTSMKIIGLTSMKIIDMTMTAKKGIMTGMLMNWMMISKVALVCS